MQYVIRTTSGVVTPADKPGILYGCIITGGASAGSVAFKDGGTGGTAIITIPVPANAVIDLEFPKPIRFTKDIYATITNATFAYISFEYWKANHPAVP